MKVSEIIDQLVEYRREYGDVEVDRGILVPGGVMVMVPETAPIAYEERESNP